MSEDGSAARILLIDDEEVTREVVKELLEALGYDVLMAEAGKPGLELLQANPVDVVITDFSLPDMDGAAVAAEVRKSHPGLPLVLLSGWGSTKSDVDMTLFDFAMGKPCRLDVLADTMEQALARGAGTA